MKRLINVIHRRPELSSCTVINMLLLLRHKTLQTTYAKFYDILIMCIKKGFLYDQRFHSFRIHKYPLVSDAQNAILDIRYFILQVPQCHKS